MKTQSIITVKKVATALIAGIILTMAACSGGKGSAEEEQVKPPDMDIITATILGDIDAIKQHIKAGTDLNQREPDVGSTALITAAVFDKTDVALALIEAGADLDIQNNEGSTALHSAAFLCRTEIVNALLEHGADKTIKNNYGSTALESVMAPFVMVRPAYEQFSKDLGPLGLKLDLERLESTRPVIAELLQ